MIGFYEATQRLSCNCTSAELTQFDGRARGDDVMANLTVSLLRASQVTVGKLAYRCTAPIHGSWSVLYASSHGASCACQVTVGKLAYRCTAPIHGSWSVLYASSHGASCACQVTVGKLAYRCTAPIHGSWSVLYASSHGASCACQVTVGKLAYRCTAMIHGSWSALYTSSHGASCACQVTVGKLAYRCTAPIRGSWSALCASSHGALCACQVVFNPTVSRGSRSRIFNERALRQIAKLYNWCGTTRWQHKQAKHGARQQQQQSCVVGSCRNISLLFSFCREALCKRFADIYLMSSYVHCATCCSTPSQYPSRADYFLANLLDHVSS